LENLGLDMGCMDGAGGGIIMNYDEAIVEYQPFELYLTTLRLL